VNPGTVAVGFLHPGEWSACFGQSLTELYLVDATIGQHRLVRQLPKFCAAGGLVAGRNEIVEKFLDRTDCEWLWMIDSDMGFGPTTVDDLIGVADPDTRPVVGGLCFALRANGPGPFHGEKYVVVPSAYRWVETENEIGFQSILELPADTLMEVSATGAACLLVHRNALDTVRKKYGDHWFDPVTHPAGPTFSEDLSFCVRLAAVDIPVFVHTGVGTTHDKGGVFLDLDAYEAQLPPGVLPSGVVRESRFTPAHGQCANPGLWTATDEQSTELEVTELVGAFVRALQPEYVVETGTFCGNTARAIGEALARNGHGHLDTIEVDPDRAAIATRRCKGLPVRVVCGSSLEFDPDGPIGFAWFDSLLDLRVPEFQRFSAHMAPGSFVGFHDTGAHMGTLEAQIRSLPNLKPTFLRTPRGVCFAEVVV